MITIACMVEFYIKVLMYLLNRENCRMALHFTWFNNCVLLYDSTIYGLSTP